MIGRFVLLALIEDIKHKSWFCHPNSTMFCWKMPAEVYSSWGWTWLYCTGLFRKCSTAGPKVKWVPCPRAPCPGLGSNGELAHTISVLHEYVLSSGRSLFLHLPLFFLSVPFPLLPFFFCVSFLIVSPGHPLWITPLERSITKITVEISPYNSLGLWGAKIDLTV